MKSTINNDQIFNSYDEAHKYSLTIPWKLSLCNTGESCWCRIILPSEKIFYTNHSKDEKAQEFEWIISDGSVDKETAEYLVNLHNYSLELKLTMSDDINKPEPMGWAVMQPDSYRVFVSYDQALEHREDCAGGDIVPLYKQVEVLLNEEQKQAIQYFIDDSDSYDRVGIKETKIAADLLRSILQK